MIKIISPRTGRVWLMILVVVSFLGAMVSLFLIASGGAIHSQMFQSAAAKLLGFYLPLLSLISVFFFTKGKDETSAAGTPIEAFLFAIVIVTLWVSAPILLLWFGNFIEDILAMMETFKPFGDTLAFAALGYFFSKSSE